MADHRKIYRSPARAANPAPTSPAPSPAGGTTPPRTGAPKRKRPRRRRSRLVLALCLVCVLVVAVVCLVLTRCSAGPTGPVTADFGTAAAAWQKNELGYYFNANGEAMPAARDYLANAT